jgi:hypothetical protein
LSILELNEFAEVVAGDAAAAPEAGEAWPATDSADRIESVVLHPSLLSLDNASIRTRGIRKRRSAPIIGFGGLNGQGKTFGMVRDSLLSLALGRRILSTVAILDPHTGNPHPLYEPFRAWSQLHDFRNGDVLLDEVTGIMDSRDQGMPKHVRRLLPQMRRANVMVRWTGIDWDNSDRRLRQLTQAFVKAKGHLPNNRAVRGDGIADAVPMWAPNRLFVLTTFDAQTLASSEDSNKITERTSAQQQRPKTRVLNREFVWGPGSLAFQCYNTLDSVAAVDSSCIICGGRVPDKLCKGHDDTPEGGGVRGRRAR